MSSNFVFESRNILQDTPEDPDLPKSVIEVRKPIRQRMKARTPRYCSACGGEITGPYYEYDGGVILHDVCFGD
jgi:hypothetical protein